LHPAKLLLVVLVGNAKLAKVAITLAPVEETEAHAPAALPLRSVLSFVERHGAPTESDGQEQSAARSTLKGDGRG